MSRVLLLRILALVALFSCRPPQASPSKPTTAEPPAPKPGELSEAAALSLLSRLPPLPLLRREEGSTLALPQKTMPPPERPAQLIALAPPELTGLPSSKPIIPSKPLQLTRVTPTGEIGQSAEISVHFSQAMVELGAPDQVDDFVPLTLTPAIEGRWYWKGTQLITFEARGRLPMATEFTVEIPAGTKSQSGGALAEVRRFSFMTAPPRLQSYSPQYGAQPLRPPLFMAFDQRIDPEELAKRVAVKSGKRSFRVRPATATEQAEEPLKELIEARNQGYWLALMLEEDLPMDSEVLVTLPAGAPSAEGPRTTTKDQTYNFRTYGPLRLDSAECGYGACYQGATFSLRFNDHLDQGAFDPALIKVEPPPKNLLLEIDGQELLIKGETLVGKTYQVTIPATLQGSFGQTLGKKETTSFTVIPLPPSLESIADDFMVLDSLGGTFMPILTSRVSAVKVKVYQVKPSHFEAFGQYLKKRAKKKPATPPGVLASTKTITISEVNEDGLDGHVEIELGDALPTGLGSVIVEVEPSATHKELTPLRTWVQFTKLAIDTYSDDQDLFALVTHLESGAPLAGVEVELYPLGTKASTDKDGMVSFPLTKTGAQLLIARSGDDLAFLPSDDSMVYRYGRGYEDYSYDDGQPEKSDPAPITWRRQEQPSELRWYLASDRHLYRPGEEAKIKGWLRRLDRGKQGDVALEETLKELTYTATDKANRRLASGKVTLSKLGGFELGVALPKDTPLGSVSISFTAAGPLAGSSGSVTLQVREFRRPEFEVKASPPVGPIFAGDEVGPTIKGSYYAGGALPDAEVRWDVSYQTTSFTPPNRRDFHFGPHWAGSYEPSLQPFTKEALTNPEGSHALSWKLPLTKNTQTYATRAEASIQDLNRQAWTSKTSWLVHPAAVYVGANVNRSYFFDKAPIEVETIVVDLNGEAVAGRPVDVEVSRYETRPITGTASDKVLDTQRCTQTSARESTRCIMENRGDGFYEINVSTTDAKGRKAISQLSVYVFGWLGSSSIDDSDSETPRLQLIAEKQSYQPGETAKLLLVSPYFPAEAVLTTDREGLSSVQRLTITEANTTLSLPITEQSIGGVTVRVNLHTTQDAKGKIKQLPESYRASTELKVSAEYRRLKVGVSPSSQSLRPGEEATVTVSLKDISGAPVVDGEVALVVVDEAILALADDYRLPDPLLPFYPNRYPSSAAQSLRQYAHLISRGWLFPLRGYSGSSSGYGRGGGGAGGGSPPPINARSDYRPLAFFDGALRTDARGEVSASFTLPDTLTRYRIMAIAADAQRFGEGEGTLTAALPLMVRPSAPRFLRAQDTFALPVLLQNNTDDAMTVEVAARASGLTLEGPRGYQVTVPAHNRVEVLFPGRAAQPGEAHVQVVAATDALSDAALFSLPVYSPASTEAFATYGVLEGGAVISQPISAPKNAVEGYGGLSVSASSTALSGLSDALLYLTSYPYECSEQLASKIIGVAALRDVLAALSAKSLPPPKELEQTINAEIKRLVARQNSDGSFGLWKKGDTSWPYLDVYVSLALVIAKEEGFAVPEEAMTLAASRLKALKLDGRYYAPTDQATLQTYALYVRGLSGEDVSKEVIALAAATQDSDLSTEGAALLLASLKGDQGAPAERLRELLYNRSSEKADTAQLTEGTSEEGGHLLLRSDQRTDALGLLALMSAEPKSELIPKLTRGLLGQRRGGRWASTQENAWVLYALKRYFDLYESAPPDFTMQLWLGDKFQGQASFTGYSATPQRAEVSLSDLAKRSELIVATQGTGRLYYRLGLSYLLATEALPAASYGFSVTRVYEAIDHPEDVSFKDKAWYIRAGARVKVRVTMTATSKRYHVALVDPLPAGLEAQDPSLATSASSSGYNFPLVRSSVGGWGWSGGDWYMHRSFRDERVESATPLLPAGVYELSYTALATTPGVFRAPPAQAEEMYAPETFGRSEGALVIIEARKRP